MVWDKSYFYIYGIILLLYVNLFSAQYWVDDNGEADWGDAQSSTPLSGTDCASLATANSNAAADDTVNLREGTYDDVNISPTNSGTSGHLIVYQGYAAETITFTGTSFISLVGDDYIKVDNMVFDTDQRWFHIGDGSDYNEISNCEFKNATTYYSLGLISFYDVGFSAGDPSCYNWIHDCTFHDGGYITSCDDKDTLCRIGGAAGDASYYNLIEDCVFYYGGHDCTDIGTKYNTVRNCTYHNEGTFVDEGGCTNSPASGYFGNRCLITVDYGSDTGGNCLIECNRMGYGDTPPDDDGAMGIENGISHMSIRYSYTFGNGAAGIYWKTHNTDNADSCRVYNNTVYSNGYGDEDIAAIWKSALCVDCNGTDHPTSAIAKNNILYGNAVDGLIYVGGDCTPNFTLANNYTDDPSFVNTDMSDSTSLILPDLTLQAGSGAIDQGGALTTVAVADIGSGTSLIVADALYFQDGSWAPPGRISADWIAVGTVTNVVQIASIDYNAKTITLANSISREDNDDVWLYKNSSGDIVLYGDAPDAGAYEYASGGATVPGSIEKGSGKINKGTGKIE